MRRANELNMRFNVRTVLVLTAYIAAASSLFSISRATPAGTMLMCVVLLAAAVGLIYEFARTK